MTNHATIEPSVYQPHDKSVPTEASSETPPMANLSTFTTFRLWWVFQVYVFVICFFVLSAWFLPIQWWGVTGCWGLLLTIPLAISPLRFAVEVYGRFPKKLRVLRRLQWRIEHGEFTPDDVAKYCGDPCFRVVAYVVLSRANVPFLQRFTLLNQFAKEVQATEPILVFRDETQGVVFQVNGTEIQKIPKPSVSPLLQE